MLHHIGTSKAGSTSIRSLPGRTEIQDSGSNQSACLERRNAGKLVIHIGLQKTGTTFLQRSLDANRAALAACGLHYPDPAAGLETDAGTAHHFLAHALMRRRLRHTPQAGFDRLKAHVAALQDACATAPGTAVISSEDFSLLRREHIQKLRALFPGDGVRILVYLRRQDLWLEAMYGQTLKVGRRPDIDSFIARNRRRTDYPGFLAPWASVFGAENLIVRVYEGFETGGLWADFCTAIGCAQASGLVSDRAQVNVSLSPEANRFLAGIRDDRWRSWLRLALERGETRRMKRPGLNYLSAEQAAQVMRRHREGNARVAARHLGRKRLFRIASPLPVLPGRSPLRRRAQLGWTLLAGMVLRALGQLRGQRQDD